MIAADAGLPDHATERPPIVLIHGAANSAGVWAYWQRELARAGWPTYAIDLRGHGASEPVDLARVTMGDYAADVSTLVQQLARPPIVIGWSMGGLVAMMVAASGLTAACVGLAPSMPARAVDSSIALRAGEFGAEEYGIASRDPDEQPAMPDLDRAERLVALASLGPESQLARDERQRGIVIEALPCPLLVVTGGADHQWPRERYRDLWLAADYLSADGASHWGLVLNRRTLGGLIPTVLDWLANATGSETPGA